MKAPKFVVLSERRKKYETLPGAVDVFPNILFVSVLAHGPNECMVRSNEPVGHFSKVPDWRWRHDLYHGYGAVEGVL